MRKNKGLVTILCAALILGGVGYMSNGFKDWNPDDWRDKIIPSVNTSVDEDEVSIEEPTSEEPFKFELIREYDLSNYSESDFIKEEKTMYGSDYFSWKLILNEDEGDYLEINTSEDIFSLDDDLSNVPCDKIILHIEGVKELDEDNKKYVANIFGVSIMDTRDRGVTFAEFRTRVFEAEELGLISVYELLDN